ncbi:hypothetical protein P280DRAFT_510795 [Massarina eburnea CBS 473.64]|uniref:Rhodopsin domain-containing protein n=1 Tax=Massarina eburnea CBS 473.64 TaxID=1395130 RepID=A0A6A6RLJ1_9PLEO|nr:hypothetical protein P280DRAFT_510795 [Massarina eburnea CBS 473.64]
MSTTFLRPPHDDKGSANQPLVDVCVSFAVLETLFVAAFILSWYFNKGNNSSNTRGVCGLIMMGYIFCFGGAVIGILKLVIGGAGRHAHELPPETVRTMLVLIKAHELVYVLSIPFPKLAIIFLYIRLFTTKISKVLLYLTGTVITATALFGCITIFTNCRPFHGFWDHTVRMKCTFDPMTALRFYSVPNIVTDTVLVLIPIPALYRLNVSLVAKVGAAFTFLISTVGIITAVFRFVAFLDVNMFSDVTYLCISTTCWSIIEPGVYLMAATVPTLRPLVRESVNYISPGAFSCGTSRPLRSCTVPTTLLPSIAPTTPIERPRLTKKSSANDMLSTIGRKPSRALQLDDYHYLQYGSGNFSVRSDDEESMVCADAIVRETMGRQGRNPDGTLMDWSLQPIQMSPLRTSFFFASDTGRSTASS